MHVCFIVPIIIIVLTHIFSKKLIIYFCIFAGITNEIFQIDYFEKSKNNQELLSKINELESLLEETKAEQVSVALMIQMA